MYTKVSVVNVYLLNVAKVFDEIDHYCSRSCCSKIQTGLTSR